MCGGASVGQILEHHDWSSPATAMRYHRHSNFGKVCCFVCVLVSMPSSLQKQAASMIAGQPTPAARGAQHVEVQQTPLQQRVDAELDFNVMASQRSSQESPTGGMLAGMNNLRITNCVVNVYGGSPGLAASPCVSGVQECVANSLAHAVAGRGRGREVRELSPWKQTPVRGPEWGNVHAKEAWKAVNARMPPHRSGDACTPLQGSGGVVCDGVVPVVGADAKGKMKCESEEVSREEVCNKQFMQCVNEAIDKALESNQIDDLKRKAVASPGLARPHSRPRRNCVQLNTSLNESVLVGDSE